ncbi:hypothetical protein EXN66_Car013407 [Channa argus]|uniref:Uncharacterized protein n=1 Tax=Channa argus TaxID=215402 RepID=A0A6G1Q5E7_CHAAH|nr:hypothetical protein EXN66_Car013407 [Channa argus]KAK2899989.1 hypothetical protein Q8A73_013118 [Channa argus]
MDNATHLVSSSVYSWESAIPRPVGVVGDPYLAGGLVLGYLVLGLGSYIWAFWSQRMAVSDFFKGIKLCTSGSYSHLTGVQNIHGFFKMMISMDALTTITALVLVFKLFGSQCNSKGNCYEVFFTWLLMRYFEVHLHVLNALGCLLYLDHPQQAARVRWVFTAVFLLTVLFAVSCVVASLVNQQVIFGMGAVTFGLAAAIIIKCVVSTAPPSTAIYKKPVVIVAMVTVLFAFTPNFVLYTLLSNLASSGETNHTYYIAYANVLFFTNFNLLLNGLLCNFMLRVPVTEEEEQQQTMSLEYYRPNLI